MADNEYIPKEKSEDDVPKGKPTQTDKKKPPPKVQKDSSINRKKVKTIFGSTILLFSIFLCVAYLSYFFTWKIDQDIILNTSFFDYIFNSSIPAPENWLGKFGAWISHILVFGTFGISAIGICLFLFLLGIKILFNVDLLPFK